MKNLSPEYLEYLQSEKWQQLRSQRLKIDGYRCQICGSPLNLEVHHTKYPAVLGTENVYTDLISCCSNCHKKIEKQKDQYRQNGICKNSHYGNLLNAFWTDILLEDKAFKGDLDFCKYDVVAVRWEKWLVQKGIPELLVIKNIPKKATVDHFRNLRIIKILKWKSEGAMPIDLIKSGVSKRMVYKYWNNRNLALRILGGEKMLKPKSYDEVQAGGEFTPVELGGHYCVIKQVTETKSKSGKDMIVVLLDFAAPDKQQNYFMDSFKADIRPEKKWPFNGTKYIMVNDYQDPNKVSRNFKTFCTCAENSNKGFQIQWGDNWGKQFQGKQIGAVYGEVEDEYNGQTRMKHEIRWFCNSDKVSTANVPEPKYLNGSSRSTSTSAPKQAKPDPNGFMNIPQGMEGEIPF